jgi:hypothetical protein
MCPTVAALARLNWRDERRMRLWWAIPGRSNSAASGTKSAAWSVGNDRAFVLLCSLEHERVGDGTVPGVVVGFGRGDDVVIASAKLLGD